MKPYLLIVIFLIALAQLQAQNLQVSLSPDKSKVDRGTRNGIATIFFDSNIDDLSIVCTDDNPDENIIKINDNLWYTHINVKKDIEADGVCYRNFLLKCAASAEYYLTTDTIAPNQVLYYTITLPNELEPKYLEEKAKSIAAKANELMDEGDTYLASLIALNILPSNLSPLTKPYVPEAESVLRRAWFSSDAKLVGHSSYVTSSSFSPNGERVVSSSADNTIRIWDVKTGKCCMILEGHFQGVCSAVYSPDGKFIVSASNDSTLCVWDAESGLLKHKIKGDKEFHYASFNRKNTQILTITVDVLKDIIDMSLWDYKKRSCIWSRGIPNVCEPSFNYDGTRIVTSSHDVVCIWDVKRGCVIKEFRGHTDFVKSACFNTSGKEVLSSSFDGTMKIWDVNTGKCLQTINGFKNSFLYATFSSDGQSIIESTDNHIGRWDRNSGVCVRIQTSLYSVCKSFSPDGKYAVGSRSHDIRLISLDDKEIIKGLYENDCISISPNSRYVLHFNQEELFSDNETLTLQDIYSDSILVSCTIPTTNDQGSKYGFSPNGKYIYLCKYGNEIRRPNITFLWNIQTGDSIYLLGVNNSFSYDERRLLTVAKSKVITNWDIETKKEMYTITGTYACFSPNGNQIASINNDSIIIWDSFTGQCIHRIIGSKDSIQTIAYHPSGMLLASIDYSNNIIIWNTITGEKVYELIGHPPSSYEQKTKLTFSPNGNRLVSYNNCLCIWDIANNEEKIKRPVIIQRSINTIFDVSFNYDGTQAMVSGNKTAIIDMKTGTQILTFSVDYPKRCARFMPNGIQIYFDMGTYLSIIPWHPLQQIIEEARERFKDRPLTQEEKAKYNLK